MAPWARPACRRLRFRIQWLYWTAHGRAPQWETHLQVLVLSMKWSSSSKRVSPKHLTMSKVGGCSVGRASERVTSKVRNRHMRRQWCWFLTTPTRSPRWERRRCERQGAGSTALRRRCCKERSNFSPTTRAPGFCWGSKRNRMAIHKAR